jgi:hypothetical protein
MMGKDDIINDTTIMHDMVKHFLKDTKKDRAAILYTSMSIFTNGFEKVPLHVICAQPFTVRLQDLNDIEPPKIGPVNVWFPTHVFFHKYVEQATVIMIPKHDTQNAMLRIASVTALLSMIEDKTEASFATQVVAQSPSMMSNTCYYIGLIPLFLFDHKHSLVEATA